MELEQPHFPPKVSQGIGSDGGTAVDGIQDKTPYPLAAQLVVGRQALAEFGVAARLPGQVGEGCAVCVVVGLSIRCFGKSQNDETKKDTHKRKTFDASSPPPLSSRTYHRRWRPRRGRTPAGAGRRGRRPRAPRRGTGGGPAGAGAAAAAGAGRRLGGGGVGWGVRLVEEGVTSCRACMHACTLPTVVQFISTHQACTSPTYCPIPFISTTIPGRG